MAGIYTTTINIDVVDDDGKRMFKNDLTYENMQKEDVEVVEAALLGAMLQLNDLSKEKTHGKKHEH